jgi:hypothetical protein
MNNTTEKVIDFSFMQNLFDLGFMKGKGWKSHYFREAQDCFKKHFEPINKWKQNPMTPQNGDIIMTKIFGLGQIE